jgi:hypothetical protein
MTMIPTEAREDEFVSLLLARWEANFKKVEEIDDQLGVESLGKRKVINQAIEAFGKENGEKLVSDVQSLVSQYNTPDKVEQLVAAVNLIFRSLKDYEPTINAYLDENVRKIPEDEKPSEETQNALRVDRKKIVDGLNSIRELLKNQAPDWFETWGENIAQITNLRGAVGEKAKTGKRLAGQFQWDVNDEPLSEHKMGAVAQYLKVSVADLKDAIRAKYPDFDWEAPPKFFEFDAKDKKGVTRHITARNLSDETSEEDDDEDVELTVDVDMDEDESELFGSDN